MKNKELTELLQVGIDVEQALERCANNEAIYLRMLNKFLQDQNFAKIQISKQNDDYDTMLDCAHALKGVTGNLGLAPLYQTLSTLVEQLRSNKTEDIHALVLQLEHDYCDICETVKRVVENQ